MILENQRRGHFVRIYPSKNSDFYDCFVSVNRQNQQFVYQFLYSEVFFSFKDIPQSINLVEVSQIAPAQSELTSYTTPADPTLLIRNDSTQTGFNSETKVKIVKELLFEYFNRLVHLLKELKVQGIYENNDMQEVLFRIKRLVSYKFLYTDIVNTDKSRSNLSILKDESA